MVLPRLLLVPAGGPGGVSQAWPHMSLGRLESLRPTRMESTSLTACLGLVPSGPPGQCGGPAEVAGELLFHLGAEWAYLSLILLLGQALRNNDPGLPSPVGGHPVTFLFLNFRENHPTFLLPALSILLCFLLHHVRGGLRGSGRAGRSSSTPVLTRGRLSHFKKERNLVSTHH